MGCHLNITIALLSFIFINSLLTDLGYSLFVPSVYGRHLRLGHEPQWPHRPDWNHKTLQDQKDSQFDRLDSEEIAKLRRSILQGLGLSRTPDATKMNVSQEEYTRMYGVYLQRVNERNMREVAELDNAPIETFQKFMSFAHSDEDWQNDDLASEAHERTRRSLRPSSSVHSTYVYFPVTFPEHSEVEHADLRLLFTPSSHHTDPERSVEIRVYQLLAPEGRDLLAAKTINEFADSKWTEFDVTEAVDSWATGSRNLGLQIECDGCSQYDEGFVTSSDRNRTGSPVLNTLVSVTKVVRHRRFAIDESHSGRKHRTDCRKDNQRCCRHDMKVTFKELNFDYIIQPKQFDAGYCKGRCPPRYNPAHNHALMQSLIWKQDRTRAPRPCCAPSKLADLEVLHVDETDSTKLKVSTWSDMRVLECACS